jgi:hypothetical protein|tara:strand:- start:15 stop:227 length:213 start_codon:yes stop_codon:yes gene_type:complete
MSNQNAILYDNLLRRHTSIQNQINAVPQLSIEEQSRLVDINEKYSPENQEKVNNFKQQLIVLEQQLKQLF